MSENSHIKGGCRVVASAAPGMYYEKVYSNSIALVVGCNDQVKLFVLHLIYLVYAREMKKE